MNTQTLDAQTLNTHTAHFATPASPVLLAGVVALLLTSIMAWGFVDSTRVARWVAVAADLPATVVM